MSFLVHNGIRFCFIPIQGKRYLKIQPILFLLFQNIDLTIKNKFIAMVKETWWPEFSVTHEKWNKSSNCVLQIFSRNN